MTLTVTGRSMFSGAGGDTEGLMQAGIEVVEAANHWQLAVDTHRLNHPTVEHRVANLAEADPRSFAWTHVLWGSPSCRYHAPSGGRKKPPLGREMLRTDDGAIDRATAFAIIAAVEVHLHPVVLVENVPEFQRWALYRWWLTGLRELGYRVRELTVDAADFGHAQRRKRLIIVADRLVDGVDVDLTLPPRTLVPATSILDADPGKPKTRTRYVDPQIASIAPGEESLRHIVTWRRNAKVLRADLSPIGTVTAGGRHHGVVQDIDGVTHLRMLTPRELARAQGFPERYEFLGKPADQVRMIGNAVPVGVARWLGERARAAIVAAESLGVVA